MTSVVEQAPPIGVAQLDESTEIAGAVVALVRLYTGMRAKAAGPDGDLSPMFLLVRLAHQGPSRASDLAEQVCADPSTVSRQVASLVRSGLIERRADPADGRASILVPTQLGRQRVAEHARRRGEMVWPVIRDWSPQDRADLLRLVRRYTAGIEAHRDEIIAGLAGTVGTVDTVGPVDTVGTVGTVGKTGPATSAPRTLSGA